MSPSSHYGDSLLNHLILIHFLLRSGLYYYRNRYYAPALGRFISPDPIGYTDGLNMYAYVGNYPLNATYPFGLAKSGDDNMCNEPGWYCIWNPSISGNHTLTLHGNGKEGSAVGSLSTSTFGANLINQGYLYNTSAGNPGVSPGGRRDNIGDKIGNRATKHFYLGSKRSTDVFFIIGSYPEVPGYSTTCLGLGLAGCVTMNTQTGEFQGITAGLGLYTAATPFVGLWGQVQVGATGFDSFSSPHGNFNLAGGGVAGLTFGFELDWLFEGQKWEPYSRF